MSGRLKPILALAAVSALLAAGCGDDDDADDRATFENDDFGITFEYPGNLDEAENVEFAQSLGGQEEASAGLGLDKNNAILVTRYKLQTDVSEGNIDQAKNELDSLIEQVEPGASAKRVEVAGLPGFEYEVGVPSLEDARSRLVFFFDGSDEYLINCQSKPDKRQEIEDACQVVLDTLEKSS